MADSQAEHTEQQVQLKIDGPLAFIQLGHEDEKIVVLTEKRMASLENAIDTVIEKPNIRGLVIAGNNEKGFCAGADVNAIKSVTDISVGARLARRGQELFDKIAALPCITVAAISGACVGGGYELALACDFRIALAHPKTKVGLPEVKLGILPGFGGSQRLPRLIGLPQALSIILSGKVLDAYRAEKTGLLDKLVPLSSESDMKMSFAGFLNYAKKVSQGEELISPQVISWRDRFLTFTGIGRRITASQAEKKLRKETKGHYPAPPKALEVILYGLSQGLEAGLKEEARALGELIVTEESKSLVHVYFLTESASKLGRSAKEEVGNAAIAVIGGGTMGAGIAASFLAKGLTVTLIEPSEEARARAQAHIAKSLQRKRSLSEEDRQAFLEQLDISDQLDAASSASVVVEAIIEKLDVKQQLFQDLAGIVSPECILATNTSSLSIEDIASRVDKPGRVIGMHFFNPAEKMPLVEIVFAEETSDRAIAYTAALASLLGKYPVVVQNVPGFLVNRVLSPYLMEAAHLLSEGYSVDEIDYAASRFGMPMGPLRLLDEIGLDVAAKVSDIMAKAYGMRMEGPRHAEELVTQGHLGKKSGQGFYVHEGKDTRASSQLASVVKPLSVTEAERLSSEELAHRLILPLINETVRCLDEGVAGQPGPDAIGQIDLATVMGIGFAPFRGGAMNYADSLGAKFIFEKLSSFAEKYGDRYLPTEGIASRAKEQKSFRFS